jgi:hypothetical protein
MHINNPQCICNNGFFLSSLFSFGRYEFFDFKFKLTTRYVHSLGIKFGCLKLIFVITHLPYIKII